MKQLFWVNIQSKFLSTETSVHTGNICSDVLGTLTSCSVNKSIISHDVKNIRPFHRVRKSLRA